MVIYPDDCHAIDADWLRAMGFCYIEQSTTWRYGPIRVMFQRHDTQTIVYVCVSGYGIPAEAVPLRRGQMRALISILGLPVTDPAKRSNYAQRRS